MPKQIKDLEEKIKTAKTQLEQTNEQIDKSYERTHILQNRERRLQDIISQLEYNIRTQLIMNAGIQKIEYVPTLDRYVVINFSNSEPKTDERGNYVFYDGKSINEMIDIPKDIINNGYKNFGKWIIQVCKKHNANAYEYQERQLTHIAFNNEESMTIPTETKEVFDGTQPYVKLYGPLLKRTDRKSRKLKHS